MGSYTQNPNIWKAVGEESEVRSQGHQDSSVSKGTCHHPKNLSLIPHLTANRIKGKTQLGTLFKPFNPRVGDSFSG